MAGQLIPLPEHAPPPPDGLSREQLVALWCELYNAGEKLLLAGLRREIGPDGDLQAAYRDWLRRYYDDHDVVLIRWANKMNELRVQNGGGSRPQDA
ncbi:MAG: hypothetical protein FJ271_14625 [Planctomycetes bacterium]|nr:hypothetical protein [Planctomycetota bacterium]